MNHGGNEVGHEGDLMTMTMGEQGAEQDDHDDGGAEQDDDEKLDFSVETWVRI